MVDLEREMGIEPTSPAWKAGTLPLSYSRDGRSPATTIAEAQQKAQALAPAARREGPAVSLRGLPAIESTLLGQENPADGDRRSRAVQIRDQAPADLGIRGQLPQVHPAHPASRDVPNQKRPPGQSPLSQKGDQLIGAAGRRLLEARRGSVLRLIAVTVAGGEQRGPATTFGCGKIEVVLGAYVEPAGSHEPLSAVEIDDIPPRVAVPPLLRALEAPLRGVVALCTGHVQDGPPLRLPAPYRGGPDDRVDTAALLPITALSCPSTCPKSGGRRR
jgi:hypothetical protein